MEDNFNQKQTIDDLKRLVSIKSGEIILLRSKSIKHEAKHCEQMIYLLKHFSLSKQLFQELYSKFNKFPISAAPELASKTGIDQCTSRDKEDVLYYKALNKRLEEQLRCWVEAQVQLQRSQASKESKLQLNTSTNSPLLRSTPSHILDSTNTHSAIAYDKKRIDDKSVVSAKHAATKEIIKVMGIEQQLSTPRKVSVDTSTTPEGSSILNYSMTTPSASVRSELSTQSLLRSLTSPALLQPLYLQRWASDVSPVSGGERQVVDPLLEEIGHNITRVDKCIAAKIDTIFSTATTSEQTQRRLLLGVENIPPPPGRVQSKPVTSPVPALRSRPLVDITNSHHIRSEAVHKPSQQYQSSFTTSTAEPHHSHRSVGGDSSATGPSRSIVELTPRSFKNEVGRLRRQNMVIEEDVHRFRRSLQVRH